MNKKEIIKILSIGILIVSILFLGIVIFWPILNTTNYTKYEPYNFAIPFIISTTISFIIIVFTETKNINAITTLVGFIALLTLFSYKQFNIMLNYNEWLTRGMPNRFETVSTMFETNNSNNQVNPYFRSDSSNTKNIYLNNHIQINYPENYRVWCKNLVNFKMSKFNQKFLSFTQLSLNSMLFFTIYLLFYLSRPSDTT